MKNHIAEDLPARQFAPAAADRSAPADRGNRGSISEKSPEKKAMQAVYDIRYRARREDMSLQQAFSSYMQNSSLGQQERLIVKQNLFGKEGGGMRAEDFNSIFKNAAADSISNALYQVFVENDNTQNEKIELSYVTEFVSSEDRKYEIKVTDKNTGRTHVRYADREKINSLRSNPNISEVEIISIDPNKLTGYGLPYEGERTKGVQTAAVLAGKDYDKDGKVESPAKEYRGSVHNAIQRKKGGNPDGQDTSSVKEDFIHEAGKKKEREQFDVMPKGERNTVTVGPELGPKKGLMAHTELKGNLIYETGYSKFLNKLTALHEKAVSQNQQQLAAMALKYLKGDMPDASKEIVEMSKMGEKKLREFAKTPHEGLPEKVKEEMNCDDEPDMRPLKTKINLEKTKLRLMGAKNPIVMMMPSQDSPNS